MQKLDRVILDLLQNTTNNLKAHPLNLGGISGMGGGVGGPPGGFIGWLPQTRVAYDEDEFATLDTSVSGSLLDNLNHIRYRLGSLESVGSGVLIVDDWDGSPTIYNVNELTFSGAIVTDLGDGHVLVQVSGGSINEHIEDTSDAHDASAISILDIGGNFVATDVEAALAELDDTFDTIAQALTDHITAVANAHDAVAVNIADAGGHFTGTTVEAALQELGANSLTVEELDGNPSIDDVNKIIFSGAYVTNLGSGDVLVTISGGSGSALTVMEIDSDPTVSNVDKITFSGMVVVDQGDGDVLVYPSSISSGENSNPAQLFYLNNTLSELLEDAASMRTLTTKKDGGGVQVATYTSLGSGDTKTLIFATALGMPGLETLPKGTLRFYITLKQNSGTRIMTGHVKLYKQVLAGTQTLLATSSSTPALTGSYVTYEVTASVEPFTLLATDRLIAKIYLNGDSAGTSASVSVQFANTDGERIETSYGLYAPVSTSSGWTEVSDSWSYATASTITIPTDGTTVYQKWMKIRFKQGGGYKYFIVSVVAATLLTVIVNTDYTVANSAITNIAYSFVENPYGFPNEFNYSPSLVNITVGNGTLTAAYTAKAGLITGHIEFLLGSGSSMGSSMTISPPVQEASVYATVAGIALGILRVFDTSSGITYQGTAVLITSTHLIVMRVASIPTTYLQQTAPSATVPMTWGTGDTFQFDFTYMAA